MNFLKKGSSRYALVMAAAKRARQLQEGAPALLEKVNSSKYVCIALEEISAGKVVINIPGKKPARNEKIER